MDHWVGTEGREVLTSIEGRGILYVTGFACNAATASECAGGMHACVQPPAFERRIVARLARDAVCRQLPLPAVLAPATPPKQVPSRYVGSKSVIGNGHSGDGAAAPVRSPTHPLRRHHHHLPPITGNRRLAGGSHIHTKVPAMNDYWCCINDEASVRQVPATFSHKQRKATPL